MIGIDTNILARFYVDDPNDPEAAKQRPIAHSILTGSERLFVPLTVILELEWVLRAFYRFEVSDFQRVIEHLLGLSHVNIEEWPRVVQALALQAQGLDKVWILPMHFIIPAVINVKPFIALMIAVLPAVPLDYL